MVYLACFLYLHFDLSLSKMIHSLFFHFQAKVRIKWRNSYTNGIEILIRLKIDFSGHNHSLIFNLQNCRYTIKIQSGQ